MPTYDYSCDACHHEFEVFEPITAQPQKKCPKCKKNKLRRLFGAGAGLIFKGSGFYITGINFEGPAPRPLERWAISIGDDGQLVVDKSRKFQRELGQWDNTDSYIKV